MFIRELAQQTGVSTKAIRFYESIGLVPPPSRAANNYRQYTPEAIERLRFISSARSLGFGLDDIAEFLKARDLGQLPCSDVLNSMDARIQDLDQRIADLLALRETLNHVRQAGKTLPPDKTCDSDCLCNPLTVELATTLQEPSNVRNLHSNR
jgi:DNA-binding transcriptional MerR regulator